MRLYGPHGLNRSSLISKKAALTTISLISALLVYFIGTGLSSPPENGRTTLDEPKQLAAPGQVLVVFEQDASKAARLRAKREAGVEKTLKKIGPKGKKDIYLFKLEKDESVDQALKKLRSRRDVLYAEPNTRYQSSYTPNDPDFSNQWGLHNTGQQIKGSAGSPNADINAPEGWDIEQGFSNTVTVAVIDTGIDLDHPDLTGKLWINTSETPDNQIDDDSNGFVDDINGYNFAGIGQFFYNTVYGVRPVSGHKHEVAQSIKGTGRPITEIGLGLFREGTPTADIDIAVRDDLAGSDLATASISPPSVINVTGVDTSDTTDAGWVYGSLSSPVLMENKKTYYLVFSTQSTDDSSDRYFMFELYDPYTAGNYREGMQHWKAGSDWLAFPDYDFTFRTGDNGSPHDDNGHGTHVSGIAGAATDNAIGIAGVAPGVRIMSVKALDSGGGGYTSDILESIHYATDNGADVINMSLGGSDSSKIFQRAINYAAFNDVTIVAAAGNFGPDMVSWPAAFDNVIAVGATNNKDQIAGFSNTNKLVDFAAPGVDVYSAMPTYPAALNSGGASINYDYLSGTSMASPMVAGVASLILAKNPSISPLGVEKIIEKGADDLGFPGRDNEFGLGRVNLLKIFNSLVLNTTVTASPEQPDGKAGWYKTMPTVGLQPNLSNATSFYAWDTTSPVTTYTIDFQPPSEGTHTLYYNSQTPSETEGQQSQVFKVDTGLPSDPTTITSSSHTTGTLSGDNTIDIGFSGASDSISGIAGYAGSWSSDAPGTPAGPADIPAQSGSVSSPSLADGTWWFNLSTEDEAGNRTSTIHLGPFEIDATRPTGTVKINSGQAITDSTKVKLTLSASDGTGSGIEKMRFKNSGGSWSAWETFSTSKDWKLTSANGNKKVWVQFKDKAGNESVKAFDAITLDNKAPVARTISPKLSTNQTKTRRFKIKWGATDPLPSTGITAYDVQIKVAGGVWKNWKTGTKATRAYLKGTEGQAYRFRSRGKDKAGNIGGWSPASRTLVPYDNDRHIKARVGFKRRLKTKRGRFFLSTVRYSLKADDKLIYRFRGKGVKLISTKAPSRSQAKVYLDGKLVKTIDAYAPKMKYRKVVFSARWKKRGVHRLKIVNLGTPGRSLFDVDGLALTK